MRLAALAQMAAAGSLLLAAPGITGAQSPRIAPISAGERAFQKCYSCHSLSDDEEGAQGPSLKGIVGREVAGLPGYDYSPAMRAHSQRQSRWTREALDAFLADPQGTVPDNEMGFFGLRDPAERAALIDYLATR